MITLDPARAYPVSWPTRGRHDHAIAITHRSSIRTRPEQSLYGLYGHDHGKGYRVGMDTRSRASTGLAGGRTMARACIAVTTGIRRGRGGA